MQDNVSEFLKQNQQLSNPKQKNNMLKVHGLLQRRKDQEMQQKAICEISRNLTCHSQGSITLYFLLYQSG